MEHLLSDKFQIGGEASAAAGPLGRDSSAMTDAEMHAEILSYSRSRGLFGGIDIGGSAVSTDKESNQELYGTADDESRDCGKQAARARSRQAYDSRVGPAFVA